MKRSMNHRPFSEALKKISSILCCLFLITGCYSTPSDIENKYIRYVNTMIGTANSTTKNAGKHGKGTEEKGQVMPAVLSPHGMTFWTPQTRDTEKKCISPYYYADTKLQGFRASHWMTGSCTQDYGSMTLMPLSGPLKCQPENRASTFSHSGEISTPAYYSVELEDYKIHAEMTGKSRAAIFRFTYHSDDQPCLVVHPNSDEGEGYIEIDTLKNEIRGYNPVHRIYQNWGEPAGFNGYFIVQFNKPIQTFGTYEDETIYENEVKRHDKNHIGAFVRFDMKPGETLLVKVATSFTGLEGADKNMQAEIPEWNFDEIRKSQEKSWNEHLSTIAVESNSEDFKTQFYTAFYHTSFLPHEISDADGSYPSFSGGESILKMKEGHYYDDFSMWDTYRALHPLFTITQAGRNNEMMQSIVLKYKQGGWLPIFPCWNSYTSAMIGDHCIASICDAILKDQEGIDVGTAYEAMRKNAFEMASETDYKDGKGRRALDSYLKYGYIPLEDGVPDAFHRNEQVSRTLEYAYDDFVLAQVAKKLGKTDDYHALIKRARNYKYVIDPSTGFARGRYENGNFIKDFNPFDFASFICEGYPSHYTWYVPQDMFGLIDILGGTQQFAAKLDTMFTGNYYWHGNEPSHQVPFLYNYAGMPWKTQAIVPQILRNEYANAPGGISGNEDAGQMSAWYVFASLGFYPVCPGAGYYVIASPGFDKATIRLENGNSFEIIAHHVSPENIYIQSAMLNGEKYTKTYLLHQDIMNGGTLEFKMGDKPNKTWGTQKEDLPPDFFQP